jgi:pyruvate dehydrogenase E2 component (dihydrolipoamide acetyltransferase)
MTKIQMPQLSEGMADGKLLQWNVKVGDFVRAGDTLAEIEADKANMEIEATLDGTVRALHGKAGDVVAVGTLLVELEPGQADAEISDAPRHDDAADVSNRRKSSPLVQRVALQKGIDLEKVTGTGEAGEVLMHDLDTYIAQAAR